MQEFNQTIGGKDADYAFDAWVERYPESFVLNRDGSKFVLHFANCTHFFRLDSGRKLTAYPKYCCTERSEVDAWAQAKGHQYKPCPECTAKGLQ